MLERSKLGNFVPQFPVLSGDRLVAVVDFAFVGARVAVEADGYTYHHGRKVWKSDLRRRNDLLMVGWEVYHVTWDELMSNPRRIAADLHAILRARSGA